MRVKIRRILQECIENGIEYGYSLAHQDTDEPSCNAIMNEIEMAIWLELDKRINFESDEND
jgi:hypothetical protein